METRNKLENNFLQAESEKPEFFEKYWDWLDERRLEISDENAAKFREWYIKNNTKNK